MITDVYTELAARLTGVTCGFGEEALGVNNYPPRMVWVPATDTFGDAMRTARSGAWWPKSVGTALDGVTIILWAAGELADVDPLKDVKAVHLLRARVLFHLRAVAAGSYTLESGALTKKASIGDLGRRYEIQAVFSTPIVPADADNPVVLATITNVNTDPDDGDSPAMEGTLDLPAPAVDPVGRPAP